MQLCHWFVFCGVRCRVLVSLDTESHTPGQLVKEALIALLVEQCNNPDASQFRARKGGFPATFRQPLQWRWTRYEGGNPLKSFEGNIGTH